MSKTPFFRSKLERDHTGSDFTVPGTGTEDPMLCPSVKASRHFLSVPRYFGTVILLIFRTKYAFFVVLHPFLDPAVVMANYYM